MNRSAAVRSEATVDALHQAFNLFLDLTVFIDLRAAGDGDPHETEAPLIFRIFLEEALDGLEPADDPLRIVQSIDAEPDDWKGELGLGTELSDAARHPTLARQTGPRVVIDADRERPHP